ncbi:MAG: flagellar biosynthesis protein FlhB [Pseudomonadota bacterium]
MAEDSDLERTEPASERRLEQAREKGQVARSPELSTFAILLAAGGVLTLMGPHLMESLATLLRKGLTLDRATAFDPQVMMPRFFEQTGDALMLLLPLLLVVAVVALAAPLLVSGWIFTFQAMAPDFNRLNPAKGISRILSWHSLIELGKAVAKALIIGGVGGWVIWAQKEEILTLGVEPLNSGLAHLWTLLVYTFFATVGAMALIVAIDVPFKIWHFQRQLRMTREEVRQEMRESEGDPQLKARIRSMQREAARKRMMAEVPKATVIITNPTHYAVALRYQEGTMRAPQVVAKGAYLLAERIIELGEENQVPVVRTPPLARALYAHADLGQEIPSTLYTAVAEVLAYVYQLRSYQNSGGEAPVLPQGDTVPPELDPEAVRT